MKIFFALSMRDYGSRYEKMQLDKIRECYQNAEIKVASDINKTITDEDRNKGFIYIENNYFFPEIDKSDLVIASSAYNRRCRFTIGVIIEMEYSVSKGKKVLGIINGEMIDIDESYINSCYDDIMFQVPGDEPVTLREYKKEIWK